MVNNRSHPPQTSLLRFVKFPSACRRTMLDKQPPLENCRASNPRFAFSQTNVQQMAVPNLPKHKIHFSAPLISLHLSCTCNSVNYSIGMLARGYCPFCEQRKREREREREEVARQLSGDETTEDAGTISELSCYRGC